MRVAATAESVGAEQPFRELLELGSGGMARVYLADSQAFGLRKLVVLKVPNPEMCADATLRAAFWREAELSAQMNHPNVVQVMAVVEYQGAPVIVMEYLDGVPLSLALRRAGGYLSLRLRMHVLSQVLSGLHHFHELKDLDGTPLNAVHRDVSPQNIMMLHDGPVKVLDFGIAKVSAADGTATRAGIVKGKLQYMAPEQLFGAGQIDRRADVFAVGVMLWEAVASRRMWRNRTDVDIARSLAIGEIPGLLPATPGVPADVLEIVRRATDPARENRFATAQDMQHAIERALTEHEWLVQPRELAEFMAQHFGESRRERQDEIACKLRTLRESGTSPRTFLRAHLAQQSATAISEVGIATGASSVIVVPPRRPAVRWWLWAAAALLILVGVWIARTSARSSTNAASAQAETPPPGHEESALDGRSPEPRQKHGDSASENPSRQATSPPTAAAPPPASAASATRANPPPERTATARTRRSARATPKSKPASTTPSRAARNCNPPYFFSADGVKTYKPECF